MTDHCSPPSVLRKSVLLQTESPLVATYKVGMQQSFTFAKKEAFRATLTHCGQGDRE